MGKCLVTKLKETVTNSELKKLGVLRIPLAPMAEAGTFLVRGVDGNTGIVTIVDKTQGIVSTTNMQNRNENSYSSFQVPNGGYVEISDKYSLIYNSLGNIDIQKLNDYKNLLPTIDDYKYCKHIETIRNFSQFSGTLADLAELDSLKNCDVTYLKGDIVDYISARIAKGNATGEINFSAFTSPENYKSPTITINGGKISANTFSATKKCKLVWSSINKYYWLLNEQASVYCHGYSEGEITQMKSPGQPFEHVTEVNKV